MKLLLGLALALAACGSKTTAGANVVHGCGDADYSAGSAVGFGGEGGSAAFTYFPKCLKISAGSKVTFSGDFSMHPLHGGIADGQTGKETTPNPLPNKNSGSTTQVTFAAAGDYPYYCEAHFGSGMFGVIRVE